MKGRINKINSTRYDRTKDLLKLCKAVTLRPDALFDKDEFILLTFQGVDALVQRAKKTAYEKLKRKLKKNE